MKEVYIVYAMPREMTKAHREKNNKPTGHMAGGTKFNTMSPLKINYKYQKIDQDEFYKRKTELERLGAIKVRKYHKLPDWINPDKKRWEI